MRHCTISFRQHSFLVFYAYLHCVSAVGVARPQNECIGIMFLTEVALGNEHYIKVDNGSLTCAPKGYDSIVARGRTEPGNCHHGLLLNQLSVCLST